MIFRKATISDLDAISHLYDEIHTAEESCSLCVLQLFLHKDGKHGWRVWHSGLICSAQM